MLLNIGSQCIGCYPSHLFNLALFADNTINNIRFKGSCEPLAKILARNGISVYFWTVSKPYVSQAKLFFRLLYHVFFVRFFFDRTGRGWPPKTGLMIIL